MIPASLILISFNLKVAGYPSPPGLGKPLPGSSTTISVTTPFPFTFLGQGGGIRTAEIPIGLSVQDLVLPVETFIFLVILKAKTTGLVANVLVASPGILLKVTSNDLFPLVAVNSEVFKFSQCLVCAI